jgi:outer membrane immunogenic protein
LTLLYQVIFDRTGNLAEVFIYDRIQVIRSFAMRKCLFLATLVIFSDAAALAADLPSRKAPPILPPPPPPLWSGFYAGLNAGYGFGTNSNITSGVWGIPGPSDYWSPGYLLAPPTTLASGVALSGVSPNNKNGFIGGGQVGYNYQFGQSFVIGLEADIQGAGIRGSGRHVGAGAERGSALTLKNGDLTDVSTTSFGGVRINAGVDWLGTVRGRIGYLFTPTLLVYGTGGLTYGGVYANVANIAYSNSATAYEDGPSDVGVTTHTFIGGGQKSQTLVGWNAGGGLEWLFAPNWSVKAEAFYWNLGNMNVPTAAFAAAPRQDGQAAWYGNSAFSAIGATRVNYQGVIARVGVNYHFNWGAPAPVVANF